MRSQLKDGDPEHFSVCFYIRWGFFPDIQNIKGAVLLSWAIAAPSSRGENHLETVCYYQEKQISQFNYYITSVISCWTASLRVQEKPTQSTQAPLLSVFLEKNEDHSALTLYRAGRIFSSTNKTT